MILGIALIPNMEDNTFKTAMDITDFHDEHNLSNKFKEYLEMKLN